MLLLYLCKRHTYQIMITIYLFIIIITVTVSLEMTFWVWHVIVLENHCFFAEKEMNWHYNNIQEVTYNPYTSFIKSSNKTISTLVSFVRISSLINSAAALGILSLLKKIYYHHQNKKCHAAFSPPFLPN